MKPESSTQFSTVQHEPIADTKKAEVQKKEVVDETEDITSIVEKLIPAESYTNFVVHPISGESLKVVDIEKIKEKILQRMRITKDGKNVSINREKIAQVIFERHKNEKVLLPLQIKQGDYQPKPLFYYPASIEKATDPFSIVYTDFHTPLWDLDINSILRTRDSVYPTKDGEGIGAFEARVALKLFHPKYGDGRYNKKDGKWYFKNRNYDSQNPASPEMIPFSRDLLRQYGLYNILNRELTGERTPEYQSLADGLEKQCPHLFENGTLSRDDIRQFTITRDGEASPQFEKTVGDNAYVMLRGVNQYVGRRFAGCVVSPFGDEKALVFDELDDTKRLRAIFTIVDKADASEVYVGSNGTQIPRANGDKTKVTEIKYEKLVPEGTEGKTGVLLEQKRKKVAGRVTQTIVNLLDMSAQAEVLVREQLEIPEVELQTNVQEVRRLLLNQAERVIAKAAASSNLAQLEEALVSSEVFAQTFVALLKSAGVEKMLRNPLDAVRSNELTQENREVMRRLLRDNYETAYPGETNQAFRETVAASLEAAFSRPTTDFYLLKDGDNIVSFNRFDTNTDTESGRKVLYFGSFNADPKYRGVGGVMLEHTIQEKLQTCDAMQAHCDPRSDISKKYIEDGFIATNTETVAGKFSFEIWRSKDSERKLKTKGMSQDELVALANETVSAETDYFVREVEQNDQFLELDSGLAFLMTRYFTVGGKTYAAFELNPELSKTFVAPAA